MQPIHWNENIDGPLSEQAMRHKMEQMGCRVSRYDYPPGTHFPGHSHEVDKIDGVLAGRFEISISGESVVLAPGDMLAVPKGIRHSARVLGTENVISLDGIQG